MADHEPGPDPVFAPDHYRFVVDLSGRVGPVSMILQTLNGILAKAVMALAAGSRWGFFMR